MSKLTASMDKVTKHYARFVLPKKGQITGVLYVSKKLDIPASLTISLDGDTEITEKTEKKARKGGKKVIVTKPHGNKGLKGNLDALGRNIASSFKSFVG